ncbi:Guanosine-diphosphatase, partial [Neolecta irregularis DAH-3]
MRLKFAENAFFISILVTAALTYAEAASSTKSFPCWGLDKCSEDNTTLSLTPTDTKALEYVLIIDAGHSQSRIHVYTFKICNGMSRLEDEDWAELKPGLPYYITNPIEAAKSLDPLLEFAMEKVPKELQDSTSILVKANIGLKSHNEEAGEAILDAIRKRLKNEYPFPITKDGVGILSGEDKAVHEWISANYLLCRLNSKK